MRSDAVVGESESDEEVIVRISTRGERISCAAPMRASAVVRPAPKATKMIC